LDNFSPNNYKGAAPLGLAKGEWEKRPAKVSRQHQFRHLPWNHGLSRRSETQAECTRMDTDTERL